MSDAALMPAAREFGVEEGCDARLRHVTSNEPRAQSNDIRVIVLAGELGRERVVNARTAAFKIAVYRNRNADAAAAHGNSPVGFPKSNERTELGPIFSLRAMADGHAHTSVSAVLKR